MSGLSRTPGKRVWANPHRGFESRPLRQMKSTVILKNHSAFFFARMRLKLDAWAPCSQASSLFKSVTLPPDCSELLKDLLQCTPVLRCEPLAL